jgi:type II secretory pathway pseudopilin PulG
MNRNIPNMNRYNRPSVSKTSLGFTMVELLVTIGILVVVTAGVATIFNSVGGTVAKGRKLSELNRFAARVERIMREDFDAMTRDGFLVIVNKNASNGFGVGGSGNWDVQLFRGEQSNIDDGLYGSASSELGRVRRSDEIMFFARGDFETARRAISSSMIARSHEAAIYYGLGQKRRPQISAFDPDYTLPANFFFNPVPWDTNVDTVQDVRVGVREIGRVSPNEFARDWSLLRHVTLLANPQGSGQVVPKELFGLERDSFADRPFLLDSDRQVSLQPAARSIFTSLSGTDLTLPVGRFPNWIYDGANTQPIFPNYRVSGLVDIVTEDLATIRTMIQALPVERDPSDYFDYSLSQPQPLGLNPILTSRDEFETEFWNTPDTPGFASSNDIVDLDVGFMNRNTRVWQPGNALHTTRMRKWMIDALPSRWDLTGDVPFFVSGVRYEDIPTRVLFEDSEFDETVDTDNVLRAFADANQEMLGSSVFVPRCTEFIVEWSYGFVDNSITPGNFGYKDLIWYGLDRRVDSNNDGLLDTTDRFAASPYRARSNSSVAGTLPGTSDVRDQGMNINLVVGRSFDILPGFSGPDLVEVATFGYSTQNDEVPPGGAGAGPPRSVEPHWPKFIRVTMSLADPTDLEVEQTYQVVFEVPDREQ